MSDEKLRPVGWRYSPSKVWGDQVLTQDSKTAQLARDMGRDVEPLYTEAQMLARVAAERERCAKLCEEAKASIWALHDVAVKQAAENVCENLAARMRLEPHAL